MNLKSFEIALHIAIDKKYNETFSYLVDLLPIFDKIRMHSINEN